MRRWIVPIIASALVGLALFSSLRVGQPPQLLPCVERGVVGPASLCDLFQTNRSLLIDGHRTSVEHSVGQAKHPLYLPGQLPAALADERPEFWVMDRQVGVRYRTGSESGLVITYSLWPPGADPAEHYADRAGASKVGKATTFSGWPAYAVPAAMPGDPPSRYSLLGVSAISTTIDRTEVSMFGRVPIEDLMVVAGSLRRIA